MRNIKVRTVIWVVLFVILIFGGFFILWFLISGLDPRKQIEDNYFDSKYNKFCILNKASLEQYNSLKDCKAAWRCIAKDYAKLVPEKDVKNFANSIKDIGIDSSILSYEKEHPEFTTKILELELFDPCWVGRHKAWS